MDNKYYCHSIDEIIYNKVKDIDNLFLDDGLYSHYYYSNFLKNPIFGITCCYIDLNNSELRPRYETTSIHLDFLECKEYTDNYYLNNCQKYFMNIEELKYLHCNKIGIIAAHSYFHDKIIIGFTTKYNDHWSEYLGISNNLTKRIFFKLGSKLANIGYISIDGNIRKRSEKEYIDFIRYDTELLLEFFDKYLNYKPEHYIFPFNQSSDILIEILKEYGFRYFHGKERIEVTR
jgi:hypothetical protein